jgi:hypothetical protein
LVKQAIVNCYLLIVNSQHLGSHDAIRDGVEYAHGPCDACAVGALYARSRERTMHDFHEKFLGLKRCTT